MRHNSVEVATLAPIKVASRRTAELPPPGRPQYRDKVIQCHHISLPTVLCREIGDADVGSVAELLRKGFPGRTRQYWLEVFDRLRKHPAPSDMPTYGYLMESASAPVGVILLISTMMQIHDTFTRRCNFSSWYMEPRFRTCTPVLSSQAINKKDVTCCLRRAQSILGRSSRLRDSHDLRAGDLLFPHSARFAAPYSRPEW